VLEIEVQGEAEPTIIKVFSAKKESSLLDSVGTLGKVLPKKGNCGRNVGDIGDMFGLGYRNPKKKEVYCYTKIHSISDAMKAVSNQVADFMGRRVPEELKDIQQAVRNQKSPPPPLEEMGGSNGPGISIMISRNLGNSSHFNIFDKSRSFAIWAEDVPGRAKHWYFILPDVSIDGSLGCCSPPIP